MIAFTSFGISPVGWLVSAFDEFFVFFCFTFLGVFLRITFGMILDFASRCNFGLISASIQFNDIYQNMTKIVSDGEQNVRK